MTGHPVQRFTHELIFIYQGGEDTKDLIETGDTEYNRSQTVSFFSSFFFFISRTSMQRFRTLETTLNAFLSILDKGRRFQIFFQIFENRNHFFINDQANVDNKSNLRRIYSENGNEVIVQTNTFLVDPRNFGLCT